MKEIRPTKHDPNAPALTTEQRRIVDTVMSKPADPLSHEQRASVLESYAQDVERYGRPLDSGLPFVLRDAAERIRHLSRTPQECCRQNPCEHPGVGPCDMPASREHKGD